MKKILIGFGGLIGVALLAATSQLVFNPVFNNGVFDGGLTVFGPAIVNGTLVADAGFVNNMNAVSSNVSGLTILGGGLQVDGGIQLSGAGVDTPGPTLNVCAFGYLCSSGAAFELDNTGDIITSNALYFNSNNVLQWAGTGKAVESVLTAGTDVMDAGSIGTICDPGTGNCLVVKKMLDYLLDAGGGGLL
jgi:hypothetical protein